jgi:release factor H-coupled RctB family protein
MIEIKEEKPFIRLMASSLNRVEGEALRQLEKAGQLHGMEVAVGLPDLHPGVGNPIGAAFLTNNTIYPHIVGTDSLGRR